MSTELRTQSVEQFIHQVEWLHEVEYGDFKRKLSLYIKRLEEALPGASPSAQKTIAELRDKLIYNPNPDIEGSRLVALNLAEQLKGQLN